MKVKKIKVGQILAVHWVDSCTYDGGDGWHNPFDDYWVERYRDPAVIVTVGKVVAVNELCFVLAQSWVDGSNVSNTFAIPKGCVAKVSKLD